jgi:hypothetical protein
MSNVVMGPSNTGRQLNLKEKFDSLTEPSAMFYTNFSFKFNCLPVFDGPITTFDIML